MKKLMRSVARHNMEKAGITNLNKKQKDIKGNLIGSKFSQHWREYIFVR